MRIGITGHQIIPAAAFTFVVDGIADVLARNAVDLIGVTSLAAGTDQLFAEAVLARGGRLHVVVPSAGYETTFTNADDLARFRRLMAAAETVEQLPSSEPSEDAFFDAGVRVVELSELLVAVWDGLPTRGTKGGAADAVACARSRRVPVEVIWPAGVLR